MIPFTYFTSESVCKGHPDKVCDIISDTILDAALEINPFCHNAVEATVKDDLILIYGETDTPVDYEGIAKRVIKDIGYEEDYNVIVKVSEQSPEINIAVGEDEGAGDQGIIFGYACSETKEFMPLSIMLAHHIARQLDSIEDERILPDGKTQVTVEYLNGILNSVSTILVSKQHTTDLSKSKLESLVKEAIDKAVRFLGVEEYITENTEIIINPSGSFVIGGPRGDSGTTGRKIVVDTYGGYGRVGGGCFSSKDPSKVDRSAAYYARYVAKNIVACNFAKECEIQVSYGIGMKDPISLYIDCKNTNKVSMEEVYRYVNRNFNFCLSNIIKELSLRSVSYATTASYGHFGWSSYPWEQMKEGFR